MNMIKSAEFRLIASIIILAFTSYIFYLQNVSSSSEKVLDRIQSLQFMEVKSNFNKKLIDDKFSNDPVKLIHNQNIAYFTKDSGIAVYIQYNPLIGECEMNVRKIGFPFKLLDYLSEGVNPYNLNEFKVDIDICNSLYGYQKL